MEAGRHRLRVLEVAAGEEEEAMAEVAAAAIAAMW
jgi:hypothetical protein